MPRPPKPIKRSILETRNAEIKTNENTNSKTLESTLKKNEKKNNNKPLFKLVLPPDLSKDLENSSLRWRHTSITDSAQNSPAIEILSSSEDDFIHHSSSSTNEVGCSSLTKTLPSVEIDDKKSSLGENSLLENSNESSSHGQDLSTPKRVTLIRRKPKQDIEMNSEDSDNDPFGFRKAEKRIMKRKGQSQLDRISDDSKKHKATIINKDSQYNDDIQSEMICQSVSLNKENNANCLGAFGEIDEQNLTQRKQESRKYKSSTKNEDNKVDNNNNQLIHDEDHHSVEIDMGTTPIEALRDKNKKEEKKIPDATSSKVKKTSSITKTADLLPLLPRRRQLERASKKNVSSYSDNQYYDGGEEMSLDEESNSNYEEERTLKRPLRKKQNEKNEKRKPKKVKKEPSICKSKELDEKINQERVDRIRHTEEIDSFVLVEEVVD